MGINLEDACRVHFAKIHFAKIHLQKIRLQKRGVASKRGEKNLWASFVFLFELALGRKWKKAAVPDALQ